MTEYFDVLNDKGIITGKKDTRENCHRYGLWHRAVAVFILNDKNEVLLQKRSRKKKMWPGMWDISAGGHVLAGEMGFQAAIRECYEELGITIVQSDLLYIGCAMSTNHMKEIVNNHVNEFYVAKIRDIPSELRLQGEEVESVKWLDPDVLIKKIKNNYEGITEKEGCWDYLVYYLEWASKARK